MLQNDILSSPSASNRARRDDSEIRSSRINDLFTKNGLCIKDFTITENGTANSFELETTNRNAQSDGRSVAADLNGSSAESNFWDEPQMRPQLRRRQTRVHYTPDEEKEVVKKLDYHLVLFLALLYMLSFLDRSSIYL